MKKFRGTRSRESIDTGKQYATESFRVEHSLFGSRTQITCRLHDWKATLKVRHICLHSTFNCIWIDVHPPDSGPGFYNGMWNNIRTSMSTTSKCRECGTASRKTMVICQYWQWIPGRNITSTRFGDSTGNSCRRCMWLTGTRRGWRTGEDPPTADCYLRKRWSCLYISVTICEWAFRFHFLVLSLWLHVFDLGSAMKTREVTLTLISPFQGSHVPQHKFDTWWYQWTESWHFCEVYTANRWNRLRLKVKSI